MSHDLVLSKLKSLPDFSSMAQEELHALASEGTVQKFTKNKLIIKTGDVEQSLFIILEGIVRVSRLNKAGKEVILTTLSAGNIVGELAILTGEARNADVHAMDEVTMLYLPFDVFTRHITQYPGLPMLLAKTLAKKLSATTSQVADLAFSDVSERLIKTFHSLGVQAVHNNKACIIVEHRPTHQDLAGMIGSSREVVSRTLKKLLSEGIIIEEKKKVLMYLE